MLAYASLLRQKVCGVPVPKVVRIVPRSAGKVVRFAGVSLATKIEVVGPNKHFERGDFLV